MTAEQLQIITIPLICLLLMIISLLWIFAPVWTKLFFKEGNDEHK